MRTRSQRAAAGAASPLHSLSKEEELQPKKRTRRTKVKTTTTEVETTRTVTKAGPNGSGGQVNGTAAADKPTDEAATASPVVPESTTTDATSPERVVVEVGSQRVTYKFTAPDPTIAPDSPQRATPNIRNNTTKTGTARGGPVFEHESGESNPESHEATPKTHLRSKKTGENIRKPVISKRETRSRKPTRTASPLLNPSPSKQARDSLADTKAKEPVAKAAREEHQASVKQRRTRKMDIRRQESAKAERPRSEAAQNQLTGEALLKVIKNARDEGRIAQYGPSAVKSTAGEEEDDEGENEAAPTTTSAQPPNTPAARTATAPSATPRSTGWGIKTLFTSFLPGVFSSRRSGSATQATTSPTPQQPPSNQKASPVQQPASDQPKAQPSTQQPPKVMLPQADVDEIGAALSPTPAEGRVKRAHTRPKAPSRPSRRRDSSQVAIVDYALRDVNPAEKELAIAWAEQTAQKISADSSTLGSKRKQLEQPMKLKDVKAIPARRPWEPSGSFGLLPEFFDDSDSDEEAPGWYLVDQLANEQPPMKKRKTTTARSSEAQPSTSPVNVIDTNGHSASTLDRRPRPAHIPSPMFDNPVTHHEGGNVFTELHSQTSGPVTPTRDREALLKELRHSGHVEGTGTFCYPEPDSDESDGSDEENEQENSLPWTQQPPPAPVPAHAQLPVPLDGSASVPQMPKTKALDPVEAQRAKAMKHTPAKQSRLREVMVPSPSLKSDVGASPFASGSYSGSSASLFATASSVRILSEEDVPDAEPLDLDGLQFANDDPLGLRELGLLDATRAVVDKAPVFADEDVIVTYSEDDEEMSDDDGAL